MSGEQILDPCCGSRMFYFDHDDPRVLFCDIRDGVEEELCDGRTFEVKPDEVVDVTDMPFRSGQFRLVILDPPHLTRAGDNGWQAKKYGKLPDDWRGFITGAFEECWRVLAPGGTLVFKWYEYRVKLSQVLECIPVAPVCGNKRPHMSKTHWLVFYKPEPKAVPPILADAAQPVLRDPAIDRAYERGRLEGAMAERRFRETLAGAAQ